MTFIVEDGTGRADATSLCAVETADAFWADRGDEVWTEAVANADKEAALVAASDYLRNQSRYRWSGTKLTYAQTMPWPRTGAWERDGNEVPDDVVPWQVEQACCYLAREVLNGVALQPALDRGGDIQSESVGPISTTYRAGARPDTLYQAVDGLLASLLRLPGVLNPAAPHVSEVTYPQGFYPKQFDYGVTPEPET